VNRTRIKTFRHRLGRNHYLVIQIFQSATAAAESGNALASNALSIRIAKTRKRGQPARLLCLETGKEVFSAHAQKIDPFPEMEQRQDENQPRTKSQRFHQPGRQRHLNQRFGYRRRPGAPVTPDLRPPALEDALARPLFRRTAGRRIPCK